MQGAKVSFLRSVPQSGTMSSPSSHGRMKTTAHAKVSKYSVHTLYKTARRRWRQHARGGGDKAQ